MLALLVDPRPEGFEALVDPEAFGAPFGPRGVHRAEPSYRPDRYWRGPAWPQLAYLVMIAAERAGHRGTTGLLARRLVDGVLRSQFAEYWHPETGRGFGARPQTWSGLALPAAARLR
jgi:glycogen debranching enzyme